MGMKPFSAFLGEDDALVNAAGGASVSRRIVTAADEVGRARKNRETKRVCFRLMKCAEFSGRHVFTCHDGNPYGR